MRADTGLDRDKGTVECGARFGIVASFGQFGSLAHYFFDLGNRFIDPFGSFLAGDALVSGKQCLDALLPDLEIGFLLCPGDIFWGGKAHRLEHQHRGFGEQARGFLQIAGIERVTRRFVQRPRLLAHGKSLWVLAGFDLACR